MVNRLPLSGNAQNVNFEFEHRESGSASSTAVTRQPRRTTSRRWGFRCSKAARSARGDEQSAPVAAIIDERIATRVARRKRHRQAHRCPARGDLMKTAVVRNRRRGRPYPSRRPRRGHPGTGVLGPGPVARRTAWRGRARPSEAPPRTIAAIMVRIHEIDPEQPVYDVRTMDEWVAIARPAMDEHDAGRDVCPVALFLCAIGVYGVIAFGVSAAAPRVRHPSRARRQPPRASRRGRQARLALAAMGSVSAW